MLKQKKSAKYLLVGVGKLTKLLGFIAKMGATYTVQSGYWIARAFKYFRVKHFEGEPSNIKVLVLDWKKLIWKLDVPNKVKLFLWRATHNIIPCASILHSRHLSQSKACNICARASETTLHVRYGGYPCLLIWQKNRVSMTLSIFLCFFKDNRAGECLETFAILCWAIWNRRNALLHH